MQATVLTPLNQWLTLFRTFSSKIKALESRRLGTMHRCEVLPEALLLPNPLVSVPRVRCGETCLYQVGAEEGAAAASTGQSGA